MKIPQKELKKWITALRSGNFKQGRKLLQDGNTYCCLGVACKILIPEDKLHKNINGQILGAVPTSQVNSPEWLYRINHNFWIKTGESLTSLNDKKRLTFDEIADLLEAVYIHKVLD